MNTHTVHGTLSASITTPIVVYIMYCNGFIDLLPQNTNYTNEHIHVCHMHMPHTQLIRIVICFHCTLCTTVHTYMYYMYMHNHLHNYTSTLQITSSCDVLRVVKNPRQSKGVDKESPSQWSHCFQTRNLQLTL